MYPSQAYRTGGTALIAKGRAEALSKRREVTAANDRQISHAVNLKLSRKGDCQMLKPSAWEAWHCCSPGGCDTRPHRGRYLHR